MEIVPYNIKNVYLPEYKNGEVTRQALKYAKKFYEYCYPLFKTITTESSLFNLFLKTFNPHSSFNKLTQFETIDEMIDAINMFDDILIALASKKGLNLCQVHLYVDKCLIEPSKFKHRKMLDWDF